MYKKIFLLGIGAQKAGTTWLHNQLVLNNNVDLGFAKEYHVLDSIFINSFTNSKARLVNRISYEEKLLKPSSEYEFLVKRLSFIVCIWKMKR